MDSYINLNNKFKLDKENKKLINIKTGEVHIEQEEIIKILEQLKQDKSFNRDMEKAVRNIWDLKTELELYQQKWKDDSLFIKIYRTEMREYKKIIKLSQGAGLLLLCLMDYIEYKTNRIVYKKDKTFTNKELEKLSGMSENPTLKALNELEEKLFIKRIGTKRAREIYFNPYLACSGNEISKDTLEMFSNYIKLTPY